MLEILVDFQDTFNGESDGNPWPLIFLSCLRAGNFYPEYGSLEDGRAATPYPLKFDDDLISTPVQLSETQRLPATRRSSLMPCFNGHCLPHLPSKSHPSHSSTAPPAPAICRRSHGPIHMSLVIQRILCSSLAAAPSLKSPQALLRSQNREARHEEPGEIAPNVSASDGGIGGNESETDDDVSSPLLLGSVAWDCADVGVRGPKCVANRFLNLRARVKASSTLCLTCFGRT